MEAMVSILALLGMGYAVYRGMRWMLKTGQVQARKEPSLSPTDLKVLEDSAARLMADLRTTTDECVARIEHALAEAETRLGSINVSRTAPANSFYQVIDNNQSPAYIAREAGMTTGEVELLRGLKAIELQK